MSTEAKRKAKRNQPTSGSAVQMFQVKSSGIYPVLNYLENSVCFPHMKKQSCSLGTHYKDNLFKNKLALIAILILFNKKLLLKFITILKMPSGQWYKDWRNKNMILMEPVGVGYYFWLCSWIVALWGDHFLLLVSRNLRQI